MIDRKLLFDCWISYSLTSPVFTLLFGDPLRNREGLLLGVNAMNEETVLELLMMLIKALVMFLKFVLELLGQAA